MPERTATEALLDLLREVGPQIAFLSRRERTSRLREHIFAAVDELKNEGLTSSSVHFKIQALAADAGISPAASEALDDLTAWCVQRYFEGPEQP